ncbi:MAG: hypothetical protein ABEK00_00150 [Candidatus Nanohaloarchaea archaeon]
MRAKPRNTSSPSSSYWRQLEKAEEAAGLNFSDSIDKVERKPMDSLASMERRGYGVGPVSYGENVLNVSPEFDYLDPELQEHVLSHEGIHALDFDNRLVPELKDSFNISSQAAQRLSVLKDSSTEAREGVTQALNKRITPDPRSDYFYPYETQQVEQVLEDEGMDLDSELLEDIEEAQKDILEEYRDIDARIVDEGVYLEYGSINDTDYSVMVIGDGAETYGEKLADNYLLDNEKGLTEINYEDFLETDLENYVP